MEEQLAKLGVGDDAAAEPVAKPEPKKRGQRRLSLAGTLWPAPSILGRP
jgi:hypothetical protein